MNGFVKSGLTLALALCACGTAYPNAHLLQSTLFLVPTVFSMLHRRHKLRLA
jgi:hypothetical protein